jgi:hypothetical protein
MFLLIPDSLDGNKFRDSGLAEILNGLKHNTTLTPLE